MTLIKFGLDVAQLRRLADWRIELDAKLVAAQEQDPELAPHIFTDETGMKHPYLGAIGGGLTFEFTPTGLGVVERVVFCKGSTFEASIDLTDYESW